MCGITGKIIFKGKISHSEIKSMQSALFHRGPDAKGSYYSKKVALAMTRLSIIDISGGNQPIKNEDGSVVIVCNGEIYNYLELRKELKKRKHTLSTKGDIETILHLYEDYGLDFAKKLRGMYAGAIYDKRGERVILFRDRLGEKPLYYSKCKSGIVFSSEMKSILKAKDIDKTIDCNSVDKYFHFYSISEPDTMFKNVKKINSGCILIINLKDLEMQEISYWDTNQTPKTTKNLSQKINHILKEACDLTLRSDVPVGVALSGGIDSSCIFAFLAKKKINLRAFTIGYEGNSKYDERSVAAEFAKSMNVEHVTSEIKDIDIVNSFLKMVYATDDPIAEIAANSIYAVSKLAHDHKVPVLIAGLGGDEIFWGYPWVKDAVRWNINYKKFLKTKFAKVARIITKPLQKPRLFNPKFAYLSYLLLPENQLILNVARPGFVNAEHFTRHLYSKNFTNKITPNNCYLYALNVDFPKSTDIPKTILYSLRIRWLVSHVNNINDRLSMANSVEQRSPLLDYKLFELALSSREIMTSYNKPNKYWFKKSISNIVPSKVLNRSKSGFTPPVTRWLFKIIRKYIYLIDNGFLIKNNILGKNRVTLVRYFWILLPFYWYQIYQIIVLEVWCREYVLGKSPNRF